MDKEAQDAARICATDNSEHIPYPCMQHPEQIKEHIELGFLSGVGWARKQEPKKTMTLQDVQALAWALQVDWGFDNHQHNAVLDALIEVYDSQPSTLSSEHVNDVKMLIEGL